MDHTKRRILGTLLFLSSVTCCLATGTWLGGKLFVPAGSGLAGPLMALQYGVALAVVGGIASVLLVRRLSLRWLLGLTLPVTAAAMALAFLAGTAYFVSQREQQAHLEQAYRDLPRFTLRLSSAETAARRAFVEISYDSGVDRFTATMADGSACAGAIAGRDKVELLTALRNVEGLLITTPAPCAAPGAESHRLTFRIYDRKPPESTGDIAITETCLATYEPLRAAIEAADHVYRANRRSEVCS